MRELDLRGNDCGPSGGFALAKALIHNGGALRVLKVADNKLGELAAAAVAAAMRGTCGEGLVGFNAAHLDGPLCISGTLSGRKRPAKHATAKLPPAPAAGRATSGKGRSETKPPVMPGLRLVHGSV